MTTERLDCDQVDDLGPAYVLGALEAGEADAVRQHVSDCERGHPELAELGGVVPYLAIATPPLEPADALRARILDAIRAEAGAANPTHADVPATARPGARLRRIGMAWRSRPRWSAVFAIVLIAALAGSVAYLNGQLGPSRAYADQVARLTALAASPGARTISIAGTPGTGPTGRAVLAPDGGGVVLDGLAPLRDNQVYEVWLIAAGATPTPAGALRLTSDGRGWLETLVPPTGPVTVAVTREPGPGATTPTLPILASGSG